MGGVDDREVLHARPPKSTAVQMHLSPCRMEAIGMASREHAQADIEGKSHVSHGAARYYYPLLSNSESAFAPTVRAYIKLLSLELVERVREHEERWHERPGKLVLSWEIGSGVGSELGRRSTFVPFPRLDADRARSVTLLVNAAVPVLLDKLASQDNRWGTKPGPVVMLGLQATAFERSVRTLMSFFMTQTKRKSETSERDRLKDESPQHVLCGQRLVDKQISNFVIVDLLSDNTGKDAAPDDGAYVVKRARTTRPCAALATTPEMIVVEE